MSYVIAVQLVVWRVWFLFWQLQDLVLQLKTCVDKLTGAVSTLATVLTCVMAHFDDSVAVASPSVSNPDSEYQHDLRTCPEPTEPLEPKRRPPGLLEVINRLSERIIVDPENPASSAFKKVLEHIERFEETFADCPGPDLPVPDSAEDDRMLNEVMVGAMNSIPTPERFREGVLTPPHPSLSTTSEECENHPRPRPSKRSRSRTTRRSENTEDWERELI